MSFENKVIIVTGSSSGIGASTAIEFAKEGACVILVGRNQTKLKTIEDKCHSVGRKPVVIKADVSNDDDAKRIINTTVEEFGKIDVLVNNAGVYDYYDILGDDFMAGYDRIVNINLRGAVYLTHLALPHLIKTKGNVINISSVAGQSTLGQSDLATYCVSKAGLNQFTRNVALKMAEYGVRVNTVSPGPVKTDILNNSSLDSVEWETVANVTALKRVSEPEEIAHLILFLASNKARGITGSEFVSDNGVLTKG